MSFLRLVKVLPTLLAVAVLASCGGDGGGGGSSSGGSSSAGSGASESTTPVARNDTATTSMSTAVKIVVLSNDSGGNGAPFAVRIDVRPTRGSVSVDSNSDVVTYTPNRGFTGSDSFKYSFTDAEGVRSNQARVDISIKAGATTPPPEDEKPVARNDAATTSASTPVDIVVLANDTAANDSNITVRIVQKPEKGTITNISGSGVVTYAPRSGGSGTDSFKYNFIDAKGAVSNNATVNVTIACPAVHPSDNYMAIGDSLTRGIGDNISSDNRTDDGCYKGLGYPPVLIDRLNDAANRRHLVVNEGVGGDRSIDGAQRIGSLVYRDSEHFLSLYGTNDSNGAAAGNAVGASAFRQNMQEIIDRVTSAGKSIYLAKIPPVLGETADGGKYSNLDQGPRNVMIRDYNRVIGELVNPGRNVFAGPDFYSYFKDRPSLYSDNVHPNGRGYQEMARLWFQKIR
jgi:lysophospholipase L1-like esterase